jgi:signal-transduction protein with cAMP-binding, CBS, and nucleotidyltransferase domain
MGKLEILRIGLNQVSLLEYVKKDDFLWRCPLLAAISEDDREELLNNSKALTVEAKTQIYSEEDPPKQVHLILDGSVSLSCSHESIDVLSLGKSDFFGLEAVLTQVKLSATSNESGAKMALLPSSQLGRLMRESAPLDALLRNTCTKRKNHIQDCTAFLDRW